MLIRKIAGCCVGLLLSGAAWTAETPEQRLQVLERQVKALSGLVLRVDALQREVQQLRGEVELQENAMSTLKKRQRDLYLDIDGRLSQSKESADAGAQPADSAAAPVGALPTETDSAQNGRVTQQPKVVSEPKPVVVATSASAREERAYQKAFELLTQRRYDESARSFREFLNSYPAGVYSDNAQYWLGETSYVTRDFDKALTEFTRLLEMFPTSSKVSGAMLKIGYIQYEKQELTQARATLATLIERFPGTSAARLAEEFIRKKKL